MRIASTLTESAALSRARIAVPVTHSGAVLCSTVLPSITVATKRAHALLNLWPGRGQRARR
ncbi:MAG TPA: hypothetical protein DCM86_18005 [Verrucomicrobiales bacterium]|nr:hypothetical protein [Verrucomicrobiales bacterium]